jgi:hypothetical protein
MTTYTTAIARAAGPIVALDLGKYKSVACVYRTADDQQFTTLPTTRAELTRQFGAVDRVDGNRNDRTSRCRPWASYARRSRQPLQNCSGSSREFRGARLDFSVH